MTIRNDSDSILRLAQNVVIPPTTEAIVSLTVPPRFRNKTSLLETFPLIKNQFLMVAGSVIHPIKNTTVCRIVNTGLKPRHLKVNMPIARISSIDMNDPGNRAMLSLDVNNDSSTSLAQKQVSNVPHEERVKFLQSKGLILDNPILSEEQLSQLSALLYEFQEILCAEYDQLPLSKLPPYHINLENDKPIRQKQYPLPPLQKRILEQYAEKLLKAGIVEPSTSPWNAPAILVRKANFDPTKADDLSSWRLVIEYRKHNKSIVSEFQSLTDSQTVFTQIAEAQPKYFSSLSNSVRRRISANHLVHDKNSETSVLQISSRFKLFSKQLSCFCLQFIQTGNADQFINIHG